MQRILIAALLLFSWTLQGQAPQFIPYQAAARDAADQIVPNQNIGLRFTIDGQTKMSLF
jgi:hypothetical protein